MMSESEHGARRLGMVPKIKKSSIILVIFLILVCPAHGILDDLKSTLAGAKKYFDDLAPYISDGIKMVDRVEKFVDSTIGEDCTFECRRGLEPRPRKGHVPRSNGCGSLSVFFDDSDNSPMFVEKEFTECCDDHDICYDTCLEDKDMCDIRFKKCLYKACKQTARSEFFDAKACRAKAKLAFLAVMGVGCQPYKDAQEEACECVKTEL